MSTIRLIEASFLSSQGHRVIRTKFPDGKSVVEFAGIDAPVVTAQAFVREERPTTGSGEFTKGELHLDLAKGDERFLLAVVDGNAQPVPGLSVFVTDPERPGFSVWGGTDANGECRLDGTPPKLVVLDLRHPTRGSQPETPVLRQPRSGARCL